MFFTVQSGDCCLASSLGLHKYARASIVVDSYWMEGDAEGLVARHFITRLGATIFFKGKLDLYH